MTKMRNINEAFPHKVCINLDRRPERWAEMQAKFERCGIHGVQRFAAVDGERAIVPPNWLDSPGAYGCLRSHLDIIQQARELAWPTVLIFEDDAAFDPRIDEDFKTYFAQVPSDWDMLHFGANHMAAPVAVSENVVRITSANSTFTYALNHTVFDAFIELNSKALTAVDLNNRTLQTEHACYCFMPHLAWVEDVSSDVQVRQKYHWYIKESLVLHGTGMDSILKQTSVIIAYQNRSSSSLNNLLFLVRFYQQYLPGITVVVVEQDREPTLTQAALPQCQYQFLPNDAPLDRKACFKAGMELTGSSFLIFSDSDVFVEEWDIRGNLAMCQRYDGTTGFSSMVNLTEDATRLLRTSKPMILTPWFDANHYSRSNKRDLFDKFCVFSRKGVEERQPRVFESPNDALQMV
ncbi:MAG TPA: glycosyltransferase family 25 protein [Pyrinomonadaceae bacterium]